MVANILPAEAPQLFQNMIIWQNHYCSNMVENILPAYPTPPKHCQWVMEGASKYKAHCGVCKKRYKKVKCVLKVYQRNVHVSIITK